MSDDPAIRLQARREARIKRIQAEEFPQFGHDGMHHGNGGPDCPRVRHHHHDWFCEPPTPMEWAMAGRTGAVEWRSRA